MICDRIREKIPEFLAGRLDAAARQNVIDHLDTCSACRAEVADLGVVWRGLENMTEPEPSQAMRTRFRETLAAYEEGYEDAQRRLAMAVPARKWWAGWWPAQPAWQMALSAALVIAGVMGGRYLAAPQHPAAPNPEIAQLKGQVENLRQMVALSLMKEQSPTARLQGVTYSFQVSQPDQQVEQALLHALNHDANVNVRLSAVDALAKFSRTPQIRRALADAISVQDSPLVQVALIDVLVQANAKDAAPALRKLAEDKSLDDAVRQRAASGLEKLGVAR
jgi:HEAT repeat protein